MSNKKLKSTIVETIICETLSKEQLIRILRQIGNEVELYKLNKKKRNEKSLD